MLSPSSSLKRFNYIIMKLDLLYYNIASHYGFNESEFDILYAICNEGVECPLTLITKYVGMKKQTINSALRKLEEKGLITLESIEGRKKLVKLTEVGIKRCNESILEIIKIEDEVFSIWPKEKVDAYIKTTQEYSLLIEERFMQLCK